VGGRGQVFELEVGGLDEELAVFQAQGRVGKTEADLGGIGVGVEDEVVFEVGGIGIEEEVDTGKDPRVGDGSEMGDAGDGAGGAGSSWRSVGGVGRAGVGTSGRRG
jgi:hypothetical protein